MGQVAAAAARPAHPVHAALAQACFVDAFCWLNTLMASNAGLVSFFIAILIIPTELFPSAEMAGKVQKGYQGIMRLGANVGRCGKAGRHLLAAGSPPATFAAGGPQDRRSAFQRLKSSLTLTRC